MGVRKNAATTSVQHHNLQAENSRSGVCAIIFNKNKSKIELLPSKALPGLPEGLLRSQPYTKPGTRHGLDMAGKEGLFG